MTTAQPGQEQRMELKACPFCGGRKFNVCRTEYLDTDAFAVSCLTRDCHGAVFSLGFGLFPTEAEAIAAWNTRPTAAPTSEVTDAMIEAGARAFCETESLDPHKMAKIVYAAMYAARPTADLGEDGELVERLRKKAQGASDIARQMAEAKSLRQGGNTERRTDLYMWPTPEQTVEWKAADRIELYREAVVEARADIDFACTAIMKCHEQKGRARLEQTLKRIDGVLSRSGG